MCNALPCFATSLLFKDEGGHLRKSAPTCMHHLLNKCTAANGWFLLLYWIFETDSCRVGVMKALPRRILDFWRDMERANASVKEHERAAKNGNIPSTSLLPRLAFLQRWHQSSPLCQPTAISKSYCKLGLVESENGDQVQPFS